MLALHASDLGSIPCPTLDVPTKETKQIPREPGVNKERKEIVYQLCSSSN